MYCLTSNVVCCHHNSKEQDSQYGQCLQQTISLSGYPYNLWSHMSNGLVNFLHTKCSSSQVVMGGHWRLSKILYMSSRIPIIKTRNTYLHGIWVCHLAYDPTTLLMTSHQLGSQVSADDHMQRVDIHGGDGLQWKWIQQQGEGGLQKDTESIVPVKLTKIWHLDANKQTNLDWPHNQQWPKESHASGRI